MSNFSKDFIFGVSTSAHQIEGGYNQGKKGENIWDRFSHDRLKFNGKIACDSYNKWQEDIELLRGLEKCDYRFSISWSRIFPDKSLKPNQEGLDFYHQFIDALLVNNITPWVTIYHWDLPQYLQELGGWENRETVKYFQEYAYALIQNFGDKVKNWIIFNEPSVHAYMGYGIGEHAPGISGEESYIRSTHHMNMAIGSTYKILKSENGSLNIGSSYYITKAIGYLNNVEENHIEIMNDIWCNNNFEPLFKGAYPKYFAPLFDDLIKYNDMEECKAELDFIGLQYYDPIPVNLDNKMPFGMGFGEHPQDFELTDAKWLISPDSFEEILLDFNKKYPKQEIYITENGAIYFDKMIDGKINDSKRIDFLEGHLNAVANVIKQEVNIKGYFAWTLMDNFEWSFGYDYKFGLVYTDQENNQKRIPKSSYYWYRDFICGNK